MKFSNIFSLPFGVWCLVLASNSITAKPITQPSELGALIERATPDAPNGYTPTEVDCPSPRPSIRSASSLSPSELSWLPTRRNITVQPMRDFLNRVNISGLDINTYIQGDDPNALPNIGIAISGGGYRAMMNGAGAIAAFDSRTPNSNGTRQLGGLLQSATYLAGLSGGNWLVGSLYVNNFTSVQSILDTTPDASGSLWQFGNSVFEGPATGGLQVLDSVEYYTTIAQQVESKSAAGYDTSITDFWGRALSFQLINATDGGPGYTWSSIANDPDFSSGNAPFPIVVADERAPGQLDIPSNTTVIEFNPFEMGSFDPTLYGFVPMEYVGANYSGGVLPDSESCVRGYDSSSFVMGTSSSLFNEFMLGLGNSTAVPSVLKDALNSVLSKFSNSNDDIADWSPNPFYGWNNASNPSATNRSLTLVDGGEDNQNIPLNPLIQPLRGVDVIFAIDASADTTYNWPNGSALRATYQRSLSAIENDTAFPAIPDDNTFINLGLNAKPTFFGCNASNQTGPTPLIVYIPNAPLSYFTNVSTFDPSYNNSQRNSIIENGFNVATRGNGTLDSQWPTCVGCAILSRSLDRTRTDVPEVCQQCFTEYCWNGTLDTTPANYAPSVTVLSSNGSAGAGKKGAAVGQVVPTVFAALLAGLVSVVVF